MQLSRIEGLAFLVGGLHLAGGKLTDILVPAVRLGGCLQNGDRVVRPFLGGLGGRVVPVQAADRVVFVGLQIRVGDEGHAAVAVQQRLADRRAQLLKLPGLQVGDAVEGDQTGFLLAGHNKDVLIGNVVDVVLGVQQVQRAVIDVAARHRVLVIVQLYHLQQAVVGGGLGDNDVVLTGNLRNRRQLPVHIAGLHQLAILQLVVVDRIVAVCVDNAGVFVQHLFFSVGGAHIQLADHLRAGLKAHRQVDNLAVCQLHIVAATDIRGGDGKAVGDVLPLGLILGIVGVHGNQFVADGKADGVVAEGGQYRRVVVLLGGDLLAAGSQHGPQHRCQRQDDHHRPHNQGQAAALVRRGSFRLVRLFLRIACWLFGLFWLRVRLHLLRLAAVWAGSLIFL